MNRGRGHGRRVQWRLPLLITLGYLIFGIVWITVSDSLVLSAVHGEAELTIIQTYKGWAYVTITAAALFGALVTVITSLVHTREALEQSKIEYMQLVNSINDGVCVLGKQRETLFVNESLAGMLGVERAELLRTGLEPYLVGQAPLPSDEDLQQLRQGRQRKVEVELTCADGRSIWAEVSIDPILEQDGELLGELLILADITERKHAMLALREANEAQRRLLNELHHRMRNNLASLHSLIDLTRHSDVGLESVLTTLRGRVSAMSTAHELLSQSNWRPLPLTQIIAQLSDHEVEGRVEINGPDVLVLPDRVAPLVSVLHELMLNAKRHGSLRYHSGTLRIEWSLTGSPGDADRKLELRWLERDGEELDQQPRPGAGLSIVEGIVRSDLRGAIEFGFGSEGATHVLTFPVDEALSFAEPAALAAPAG